MDRLLVFCLAISGFMVIAIMIVIVSIVNWNAKNDPDKKHRRTNKIHYEPDRRWQYSHYDTFLTEEKRFGNEGERTVRRWIKSVMQEGDKLLENIRVEYGGRRMEIDCLVINKYGVFTIEVKNYVGDIIGNEEDDEWIKTKTTYSGQEK